MVMRWPTTGPTDGEAGYFYRTGLSNLTPEDLRVPVPPAPVCPQGASLPPSGGGVTGRSTRQDAQMNYLSTLSIFMKQTTYLATLPNPKSGGK
jgi:hypothetical protein